MHLRPPCASAWCRSRGAAMHEYLTIHQLAEELAQVHALPAVEIANRLLSASMRGEFDGHMRIDEEELLGSDLIDAAQKHGLVRYDPFDDIIPIHRVDLETLT